MARPTIGQQYRIGSVDLYGMNGRERHPRGSDSGRVVTALKITAVYCDEDGGQFTLTGDVLANGILGVITGADLRALLNAGGAVDGRDDYVLWWYECITADGRLLDLADYEIDCAVRPETPPMVVFRRAMIVVKEKEA